MPTINLVFPHQLFENHPNLENGHPVYLVEEFLFFKQYPFHKQKIAFHRASMKSYADYLDNKGTQVIYIDSISELGDIRKLLLYLKEQGISSIHYIDPTDDWLSKRLAKSATNEGIELHVSPSPLFINRLEDLAAFFKPTKKKYFQTSFYKAERIRLNILLDQEGNPLGGKWTYDTENRKKYPAKKIPPAIFFPDSDAYFEEAVQYTETHFSGHLGQLSTHPLYPTNFASARAWLKQFLTQRFLEFGTYEDAIVSEHLILNHSVLTPMLNVGLLGPNEILQASLAFAEKNQIPINSTEGFVRQIIGWREFVRGIYEQRSVDQRTRNFWGFTRKIPASFYDGTTGIAPIDKTIKKVLKTGYCHHIERLMVLGNFMVLCEFDPDEVYRWFMELFIDAYDWVMVPNIYGMSQFADGGLLATKPYISGSNYLMKMSNYPKGEWQQIWDALFWRFMNVHRDFFLTNPRLAMLVRNFDKMPVEKQGSLMLGAKKYLSSLDLK